MLVEDNEAARRGLTRFLQAQGYDVSQVGNGVDAIEQMRQGRPPEIVLTDLQLPDVNGWDVAEFADRLVPRPLIGAITGWDLDPTRDIPQACGIDWVLLKPIDVRELLRRLSVPPPNCRSVPPGPSPRQVSQDDLERPPEVG